MLMALVTAGLVTWMLKRQEAVPPGPPDPQSQAKPERDRQIGYIAPVDPRQIVEVKEWGPVPANQFAIRVAVGVQRSRAEAVAAELGGKIVGEIPGQRLYQIENGAASEADLRASLEQARRAAGIELAFPLQRISVFCCEILDDPVYEGTNGDGYRLIGLPRAWGYLKAAEVLGLVPSKVTVGVADTPFYSRSDEFVRTEQKDKPKLIAPYPQDETSQPTLGSGGFIKFGASTHGTQVSHLIGADPDNGGVAGVAGILRDRLNLIHMCYNIDSKPKDMAELRDHVLHGLLVVEDLVVKGATVVNMSWGCTSLVVVQDTRQMFKDLFRDHPKVLFVAAAGNDSMTLDGQNLVPGGLDVPNLITVGNVTNQKVYAAQSNRPGPGGMIDLLAPGEDAVRDVTPGGQVVKIKGGTSMAAPQVTAAAALVRALNPHLDGAEIKRLLVETGIDIAPTKDEFRRSVDPKDLPATEAEFEQNYQRTRGIYRPLLALDRALFKTISNRLAREGMPPVTEDELKGFCEVKLEVSGDHPNFQVRVTLPSVGPNGANLEVRVGGNYARLVPSSEHIARSGQGVTYTVSTLDDVNTFVVKRLDTGAKALVKLEKGATKVVQGPATTRYALKHIVAVQPEAGVDFKELPLNLPIVLDGESRGLHYRARFEFPSELNFAGKAELTHGPDGRKYSLSVPVVYGLEKATRFQIDYQISNQDPTSKRKSVVARSDLYYPIGFHLPAEFLGSPVVTEQGAGEADPKVKEKRSQTPLLPERLVRALQASGATPSAGLAAYAHQHSLEHSGWLGLAESRSLPLVMDIPAGSGLFVTNHSSVLTATDTNLADRFRYVSVRLSAGPNRDLILVYRNLAADPDLAKVEPDLTKVKEAVTKVKPDADLTKLKEAVTKVKPDADLTKLKEAVTKAKDPPPPILDVQRQPFYAVFDVQINLAGAQHTLPVAFHIRGPALEYYAAQAGANPFATHSFQDITLTAANRPVSGRILLKFQGTTKEGLANFGRFQQPPLGPMKATEKRPGIIVDLNQANGGMPRFQLVDGVTVEGGPIQQDENGWSQDSRTKANNFVQLVLQALQP